MRRVAAPDAPVPFSPARKPLYWPGPADVIAAVRSVI